MRLQQIGAVLIVGGALSSLGAVAVGMSGQAVGIGSGGIGGLLLIAAFGLLGTGSALVSLAGTSPLDGRAVRRSLAIFAAGLLLLTGSAIVTGASPTESMASLPIVMLTLGGWFLTLIGVAALAITVPAALRA